MAKREEYEIKTEELVMPLIEQNNFELVDVEYVKEGSNWYLRVYIDKEKSKARLRSSAFIRPFSAARRDKCLKKVNISPIQVSPCMNYHRVK